MSGRKNSLNNYKIISAGDASGNVTSGPVNIQNEDNIGIQFHLLSGTPTGTIGVEISGNYNQNLNTGDWVAVTQSSPAIPVAITAGSPSDVYIDLSFLSAPWIRVKYTSTSGTGSFDAYIVGKAL